MKTNPYRKFLSVAMMLAVIAIAAVSCSKDDDEPTAPVVELKITSISPDTGGEGTEVNINGTGFSTVLANNTVTLSGKSCTVLVSTATLIKAKVPADAATGKITVAVGGKTVEGPVFTFIPAGPVLAIESIAPTTGPKGTEVTITGTAFSATKESNAVTINGKTATVSSASTTKLVVVIPANAGTGTIKVTVGGKAVESASFTYVYTTAVSTLAGSSSGFAEGTGSAAKFDQPYTVAVDKDGNVYVADTNNHRIRKITPAGVVTTLAGGTQGDTDATGGNAQFNYPYGVATDAAGNVYVADTHNHKIKKITSAGVVTTVAGSTGGFKDDKGTAAQFYYPTGLVVDKDGNIFVADKDNFKIRKITTDGTVSTLAGSTQGKVDATGTDAKFQQPYTVAVDANGNVYVADTSDHSIRKITSAGVVTTLAGGSQGFADDKGTAAKFNYPYGVAADAAGNVYVADTFNFRVRKITADGTVSTFAGLATSGNTDGLLTAATLSYLTGVAVGSNGSVYVADKDNHRIRTIITD